MEQCDCVQTRRTLVSLHLLDLQPLSSDILMNVPLRQYKVTLTQPLLRDRLNLCGSLQYLAVKLRA